MQVGRRRNRNKRKILKDKSENREVLIRHSAWPKGCSGFGGEASIQYLESQNEKWIPMEVSTNVAAWYIQGCQLALVVVPAGNAGIQGIRDDYYIDPRQKHACLLQAGEDDNFKSFRGWSSLTNTSWKNRYRILNSHTFPNPERFSIFYAGHPSEMPGSEFYWIHKPFWGDKGLLFRPIRIKELRLVRG